MAKRLLSILVAVLMVMALVPMSALAKDARTFVPTRDTQTWDFEGETDGWTFVDNDGDGFNWELASVAMAGYIIPAYSGADCISSMSYESTAGALTPDNWAITPAINADDLSAVTMTFWAQAQDADWPEEHFGVAVGNTPDPDAMIMVDEWDMTASVTRDNGNWYQYIVNLNGVEGVEAGTIYFAIRHFNCSDCFYLNVDTVEVTVDATTPVDPTEPPVDPTEPPVEPTPEPTEPGESGLIAGYYFETQAQVDEWTFIGANGSNWLWSVNNPGAYDYTEYAHEGSHFIMSYSFIDYDGAYQADNWAISPAVTLPEGEAYVSFYANQANVSYPEAISVYVGFTPDPADMTLLQANVSPNTGFDDPWTNYQIDLSDYAGETIYLAFYDYNYDMYEIWIDQVEFFGQGGEPQPTEPVEPGLIDTIEINGFVEPAWGEAPSYDVSVPDDAEYYIGEAVWLWWDGGMNGDQMQSGELFNNPNRLYYMGFTVYPNEGYAFEDDVTVLINGSSEYFDAENSAWDDDYGCYFVYTIDFTVEGEMPPAPTPEPIDGDLIAGFYFEEADCLDEWTLIDSDGDGNNWKSNIAEGYTSDGFDAYEGYGFIFSQSYDNNYGVLYPDNWAITPAVEVEALEGTTFSMWAAAQDAGYASEHFGIYVGNTPNIEDMVEIESMTLTASVTRTMGTWYQFTASLDDIEGVEPGTLFFAIRHYECSDMYFIDVDQVEIYGGASELIPIHEVYVDGWGTPVAGVVAIDHVFLETPDDAPYYIIYGGWRDETDQQQMWSEDHVFVAGHEYSEGCQIWAEEGYYFADDCVFYANGGQELLDTEWCYVDANDNYICYMNILPVMCEEEAPGHLWGDANGDGVVNAEDTLLTMRYAMGVSEDIADEDMPWVDVNGDGVVDMADALLIARKVMGIIELFPVEE